MKKLFLLLVILIIIPFVFAEEFSLIGGQSQIYKGREIKLVIVGTASSAFINVNGIDQVVTTSSPINILNLKINLLESDAISQSAKLDVVSTAECLENSDCNDDKPCTEDVCDLVNECHHKPKQGCPLGDACKPENSLGEVNQILSYCTNSEWLPRKQHGESCSNNYECLSNLCNGNCRLGIGGNKKMAPSWVLIIFGILIGINGIFSVITPKYTKIISRNLLNLVPNKWYRIIGIIALIISAALIIWALI